jgi:F0F1-type ATP synthase assembly protein I
VADQQPGWPELLGMGGVAAAMVAVGCVVGLLVDRAAGTAPVLLLVGLVLGLVGSVWYVVVQFRKFMHD